MKFLIIEDEEPNFLHLKQLLSKIKPEAKIVGPIKSVREVKAFLTQNEDVDLIFADIRLQDGLVFDAFDALDLSTSVIMTTAYDEYSLRAFRHNSVAYLLKPVVSAELGHAVEKALRFRQPIREISDVAGDSRQYRRRFLIQRSDGYAIVRCENISAIILDGGFITIYDNEGCRYNIDSTMEELERQLDPEMFFRINRQCFVSLRYVKLITKLYSRRLEVILSNMPDVRLQVSKDRVADFKAWLDR